MDTLRFTTIPAALQYLSDITNQRIVVNNARRMASLRYRVAKTDKPLKIDWFDSGSNMEISIFGYGGDIVGSIWREYPDKHKDDWTLRLPGEKKHISGTLAYCLQKVMDNGQDFALRVHPRIMKSEDKEDSEGAHITGQPKMEDKPLEFIFDVEDSELLSKTRTPTTTTPPSVGGLRRAPI